MGVAANLGAVDIVHNIASCCMLFVRSDCRVHIRTDVAVGVDHRDYTVMVVVDHRNFCCYCRRVVHTDCDVHNRSRKATMFPSDPERCNCCCDMEYCCGWDVLFYMVRVMQMERTMLQDDEGEHPVSASPAERELFSKVNKRVESVRSGNCIGEHHQHETLTIGMFRHDYNAYA